MSAEREFTVLQQWQCVCVYVPIYACAQVARLRTKTRLTVVLLMVPVVNAIIPTTMGPEHYTHTHY